MQTTTTPSARFFSPILHSTYKKSFLCECFILWMLFILPLFFTVHRAGFLQFPLSGFPLLAVVNPPDEKLVNTISVQCERVVFCAFI